MLMPSELSEALLKKVQRLKPIAESAGLTLAQLALAWCLRLPNVSSVIIGATKPEQIQENVGASGVKLSEDTLDAIEIAMRY
jgi:aryl-alcohol dehydrogenase-like predicted oxidoreductase